MLNIPSYSGNNCSETSGPTGSGDRDTNLKVPGVSLAAPLVDSLKWNMERRQSEISLQPPTLIGLPQRRKSETGLASPPIPLITVTGHEGSSENQLEQECVREDVRSEPGRRVTEDEVVDISGEEAFEDVDGPKDDRAGRRCVAVAMDILGRCLRKPWKSWIEARFMPREEDIHRMILTGETPNKFSRIDIESRKYFPIAFCVLISSYWVAYMYYITDEFPAKEF
jgi:hypothetical protein